MTGRGRTARAAPTLALACTMALGLAACSGGDPAADDTAAATGTAGGAATDGGAATATAIEGLEEFGDLSQDHVEGTVDYDQDPPVGGPHAAVWQNCGAYDAPIADENGVHALEHGAVWITHDPDLDEAQVNALRARAAVDTHVLVTPRDGLPSPVVASAWGVQVQLDDADDERLDTFIAQYAQGPQTPEPGAPCEGGLGEPVG